MNKLIEYQRIVAEIWGFMSEENPERMKERKKERTQITRTTEIPSR